MRGIDCLSTLMMRSHLKETGSNLHPGLVGARHFFCYTSRRREILACAFQRGTESDKS